MKNVLLNWPDHQSIAEKPNAFQGGISAVPVRQRGAGSVEYMVITGIMVAALLTPFSTGQDVESASVLQRLMDAISGQQKAYNYSTQYPSTLNIQDIADSLGDISQGGRGGDGGNANGGGGSSNGGGSSGSGSGESDSSNGEGEGAGNGQGDDTNGGDDAANNDAANNGDGTSGDGNANGGEDGNAGENDGDVNVGGAGSGNDISWEALAATAMAMCLAKPDENPIWTREDLLAYEASVAAYIPDNTKEWREKNPGHISPYYKNKAAFEDVGIEYPFDKEADTNGFSATLSQSEDGQWVLAFRGSELTYDDWVGANGKQVLTGQSDQHDAAIRLAERVKARLGDDVLLAGHSLGGGLATAASYATGLDAITFNAAGVRKSYKQEPKIERWEGEEKDVLVVDTETMVDKEPGSLRNHYVIGEVLTTLQTLPDILLPSADGTQIAHSAPCDKQMARRHQIGSFNPPENPGRERPEEYEDKFPNTAETMRQEVL